jgi:4-hydroxythreonine-4-phosphate dehydrogenase
LREDKETRVNPSIVITCGEPAGIGPELLAMLALRQRTERSAVRIVLLGDRTLLSARAARIGLAPQYVDYDPAAVAPARAVEVWHQPLAVAPAPGQPDPANARSVLASLERACDACADGEFAALVTAPVQKSAMQDAGIPFSGHTEFFADRTRTPRVVMLLVGGAPKTPLRVALVTTHLPLKDVPAALTRESIAAVLVIVARELGGKFGLPAPRIAVCGLNPHAGESGHLGREEIDIIAPAVADARARGFDITGPMPADTVFVPRIAQRFDAIVAMYHDQGLPALKAASFGHGVNVTLGLPFPRTSVDHGTALDLARDPALARTADPGSLFAAVDLAIALAGRRTGVVGGGLHKQP